MIKLGTLVAIWKKFSDIALWLRLLSETVEDFLVNL